MSVSTDRIGVTAVRCVRLLQEVSEDRGKHRLDLTGRDGIYQVYPAAALSGAAAGEKAAGFDPEGYETGSGAKVRRAKLVNTFSAATADWLHFPGAAQQECVTRDDALDSFIAALATRAAHLGRTRAPETAEQQQLAPSRGGYTCRSTARSRCPSQTERRASGRVHARQARPRPEPVRPASGQVLWRSWR